MSKTSYEYRVKYERDGGTFDSGPWVSAVVARDIVRRHELCGTTAWVERRKVGEWERVDD